MHVAATYDYVVVGAGSAGCAVAHGLARAGSVLVVEAGPSDRWPMVRMPFGLVRLMGSRTRDWRFTSTPQAGLDGRKLAVPRGRMLGGSSSINSMVWFRGRRDDFEGWNLPGWSWADVEPAFRAVEARMAPQVFAGAHPLTRGLGADIPTPERVGAGVFRFNMARGRRWSAADGFLRPAMARGVQVLQNRSVARIGFRGDVARIVEFTGGDAVAANRGVVLSAGAIGTPALLMKSGIGPADDLRAAGIDPRLDAPGVGANLHDHPSVGIHYAGPGSGYGISLSQAATWAVAPLEWAISGRGVLASPTVEGGGFFGPDDQGRPRFQSHFIPFMLGWQGRRYVRGQGYFADVTLCRPKSRGRLRLTRAGPEIDLGIFADARDLDAMVEGFHLLRARMAQADLGRRRAPEAFPGAEIQSDAQIAAHIRARTATAYHPVGTCRMGADDAAPLTTRLALRGARGLFVADASVMPAVTSANTNAPTMMIGQRAGQMIAEDTA